MPSPPRLRRCRRLFGASAILATILAAGCLVPTDGGGGPFGELRLRPTFTAGNDPATIQVHIDSIRTLVTTPDGKEPLADTIQPYGDADTLTWMLGLQSDSENVQIRLELRSGEATMYQGAGQVVVASNGLGSAPVNPIPVDYVGPPLARRVQVTPHHLAFASIGTSQQLDGVAFDGNDDPLPDGTLHWTSGDETVAIVDASGLVTSMDVGSTLVIASANGVADTASISVDTTLARTTTITADSTTMTANGTSASTVTVEVRDAQGSLVGASAGTVTLATTLGSLGTVTDHDDGTYTATLTADTVTGSATVTGTLGGTAIEDSAVVRFVAGPPSPTTTTITADSASMTANGTSTSIVTVQVLDARGHPVGRSAGTVTLGTALGSLSPVTDHDDGTYTAILTADTASGTAVVAGDLNGAAIQDSASVVFVAGPPSTTATTITADSTAMTANGISSSTVTVEVRDAHGNLVGASAGTVTLSATLGSLGAVTDHDDGTYTATLTADTAAGTAVVTGTLNAAAIQDSAVVALVPGPASPTTTTITADPTTIGTTPSNAASTGDLQIAVVRLLPDTSTITVTVRDANGNLIGASAGTVTLNTTLGSLSTVIDHDDGTYTARLTAGTTAGTAVITGTLNGPAIADSATVTVQSQ